MFNIFLDLIRNLFYDGSTNSHLMMPNYVSLSDDEFNSKIESLWDMQKSCNLCRHRCKVNRLENELGVCESGTKVKISSYNPHFGEEKCLVGSNGSGTIFISNCSMNCVYCQNSEISQQGLGRFRGINDVADIMLDLQDKGVNNINWVSPTHFAPQLVKALKEAKDEGLKIPIVYNTGGFDSLELIKKLNNLIDIYMPDIKYGSDEKGLKFSNAPNYWSNIRKVIKEMHDQVGNLIIEDGIAEKGLLIRHLVLPNKIAKSERILEFIAKEISLDTYVNIMDQYYPSYKAQDYKSLNRGITRSEYIGVTQKARDLGLYRGF